MQRPFFRRKDVEHAKRGYERELLIPFLWEYKDFLSGKKGFVMVRKVRPWPEKGEYVIATITALNPNSAFATLNEYADKRAMVHVSEVAKTWIRDIRKFLRVGQKVVAVVRQVDERNNVAHLSIKRVGAGAKREKLVEFENEKKAERWLDFVAKDMKKNLDAAYKEVGFKMQEKFGTMYGGFEAAFSSGREALVRAGIASSWAQKIEEIAKKNIKPKEVFIKGVFELKCFKPEGIEVIKKALAGAKAPDVEIKYVSAPKYSIVVKGADYPSCEKILEVASKKIITALEQEGGTAELIRER